MRQRKIYRVVFVAVTVFLIIDFLIIDIAFFSVANQIGFWIPLILLLCEAVASAVWMLVLLYNRRSVVSVDILRDEDGIKADITTFGKSYSVPVSDITVEKKFFNYKLSFGSARLHANSTIKSVGDFLHDFENVYHKR